MAGNGSGSRNDSINLFNAIELDTTELNAMEMFANEINFQHDRLSISSLFTDMERHAIAAAYALISVLGVTLNILAIYVLVTGTRTGKGIRIQLVNLAVSDILISLTLPAYALQFIIAYSFPSNLALCKLVYSIANSSFWTSMIWHTTISIERFVIVYFPIRASRYTTRHKLVVAAVVWICGCLPNVPFAIYAGLKTKEGITLCIDTSPLGENDPISHASIFVPQGVLLVTTTIIMYFLIAIKLVRRKVIGERIPSNQPRETVSHNQKVLLMLFVDGICTVMLSIPDITEFFVTLQAGTPYPNIDKRMVGVIRLTAFTITLASCYASPIIYFIFNPSFRKDMKESFCKICRKKSPDSTNLGTPTVQTNLGTPTVQTRQGFSSRRASSS